MLTHKEVKSSGATVKVETFYVNPVARMFVNHSAGILHKLSGGMVGMTQHYIGATTSILDM